MDVELLELEVVPDVPLVVVVPDEVPDEVEPDDPLLELESQFERSESSPQ
ncbi:MAG TPA: hypothetical protein VGP63_08490 [Planctomycetaceae bacterium]|nr:hypothetical protein [Planctomycetaceae bacterium]